MRFFDPTNTYAEKNCVKNHKKELLALGSRAFVITGHSSSKKNGSLDDVIAVLEEASVPYQIFNEIEENPSVETVVRAAEIGKEFKADFVIGIGGELTNGEKHDGRAPDYDDWDLNGDILMWNPVLESRFELSSMGIRVDAAALDRQLTAANCNQRRELPFHKMLLNGQLPQSIGGGIGQSRLCMLLIGTCHIGEVQASLWDQATMDACEKAGITLL